MGTFLIVLCVGGLIAFIVIGRLKTSKYTANDEFFEQNGVRVEFQTKSLIIKGKSFNVNQVTGTNLTAEGNKIRVAILLDDLSNPSIKLMFFTKGAAEQFVQRFSTALRKAGGSNLV